VVEGIPKSTIVCLLLLLLLPGCCCCLRSPISPYSATNAAFLHLSNPICHSRILIFIPAMADLQAKFQAEAAEFKTLQKELQKVSAHTHNASALLLRRFRRF